MMLIHGVILELQSNSPRRGRRFGAHLTKPFYSWFALFALPANELSTE